MTKCLAVNTATQTLSIALAEGGKVLHYFESAETRDQGNVLITHIQEALEKCDLRFADLDLLAVVVGPGSFTGIRIGLATMRGIALAADKPLIGVTSFDMFATPMASAINLIAVESLRDELYFAVFDDEGHPMISCMNETPEILARRINHDMPGSHSYILSGDAVAKLQPVFPQAVQADKSGDARNVAQLALGRFKKSGSFPKPVPYYLREADVTISAKAVARTVKN